MPYIQYKAIKESGTTYTGSLNCKNVSEVRAFIKGENGRLVSWKEIKQKKLRYNLGLLESINIFKHLATMCRMKIPLLQAFHMLDTPSSNKKIITFSKHISFCLQRGYLFSEVLSTNYIGIDPTIISIIKTGEQTGKIDTCFDKIALYLEWRKSYKEKVKNAIRYPLVCMGVVLMTFLFLTLFLVPKIKPLILQSGTETLSFSTKFIFWVHDALTDVSDVKSLSILLSTIIFGLFLFTKYKKLLKIQYVIFNKIPFLKSIIWHFFQEKFFKILCLQVKSNKNLQNSLEDMKTVFSDRHTVSKINTISNYLDKGTPLSQILQKLSFDSNVCQIVYLGEAEGSYSNAFENICTYMTQKSDKYFNAFISYLQPFLILIVSFILIWIIYALFYPLYENIINMNL